MPRLRRAVHFVPGGNEKMLEKSLALAADSLVLDLEDAVPPERKDAARDVVTRWLRDVEFGRQERVVRLNPLDSPWGKLDLEATMAERPDAYLVPKVRTRDDLLELDRLLGEFEARYDHPPGGVALLVLGTETPEGVLNIRDLPFCPRVDALTWGPLDTVYVDIANLEGLRRECIEGARMGFTGKITIHPAQIEVVNEAFTPTSEEISESLELLEAFEENREAGRMAFSFRGQMVDAPHLERARSILERARQAGIDV
jgi:citrate lyase subunit beta/citryl-CoA lyase